jgi:hypothetical protein
MCWHVHGCIGCERCICVCAMSYRWSRQLGTPPLPFLPCAFAAVSTLSMTAQWFHNGAAIDGAVQPLLVVCAAVHMSTRPCALHFPAFPYHVVFTPLLCHLRCWLLRSAGSQRIARELWLLPLRVHQRPWLRAQLKQCRDCGRWRAASDHPGPGAPDCCACWLTRHFDSSRYVLHG